MANFYRIGAGGLNWSNTGSWSATSGGASNGLSAPTSSDDVFFDSNSPATVTIAASANVLSLSLNKASLIITINASLTIAATLTIVGGQPTFNGTTGFTCDNLNIQPVTAITITFANTVEYTVTNTFYCYSSRVGSIVLFTSDHASNKALLTISPGAECRLLASFTRIDASGGRPIRSFNGTITDCTNVVSITDLKTVGI